MVCCSARKFRGRGGELSSLSLAKLLRMPCRRVTPPLLVLALIHLGLSTWALTFQPPTQTTAASVYLHLVLVAIGFWSTLDKKSRKPVFYFITSLVICACLDIIHLVFYWTKEGRYFDNVPVYRSARIILLTVIGVNLLGKVITLARAVAVLRRRSKQCSFNPELGASVPKRMSCDQLEKQLPPPPYYQLQVQLDHPTQPQGPTAPGNRSPAQALHAALVSHPASIQLAKLASSPL